MKKVLLILVVCSQIVFSQIEKEINELNSTDDLLTVQVKTVVADNIRENQTVFLGESVHYSGSDFYAKTEFVKYLVTEHGYKDIAFESDFFALQFDHKKRNLFNFWSKSNQCKELFTFLEKNNVTIWGFDNRLAAPYSYKNFTKKLNEVLDKSGVELDNDFDRIAKTLIKNEYDSRIKISQEEIDFLYDYTNQLLKNQVIKSSAQWTQILNSFKSAVALYTVKDNISDKKRIAIRDRQMAKNLDFLIKQNANKKFIIWLANGHMSKSNSKLMHGQTMGYQFRQLNPKSSYHIAVGSIKLPPRIEKDVIKASKNDKSILSLLPSLDKNYFINSKQLTKNNPEFNYKLFNDLYIFNLESNKTKLFSHFDALVFIANGEEVKYD